MVLCSTSDIQLVVVLIIIFVMILGDCLSLALKGWLYCLIGILIGFVATAYWAGVDQNVITAQFYDTTVGAWQCNTTPFNPIILLVMLGSIIISLLILYRVGRRSF